MTGNDGWRAKLLAPSAAAAQAKPVITGYDMAGLQYIRFYDYRRAGSIAFDGRINSSHVDSLDSWALLVRAIPIRRVPFEMLAEARGPSWWPDYSVSQLVYASLLFGALCARMVSEVVSGGQVRRARSWSTSTGRCARQPTGPGWPPVMPASWWRRPET